VLLVDTFDTDQGVRNAIEASRATRVPLRGVRIDSGDLATLSQRARARLDEAGLRETLITVSGDLEEEGIAALVAAGAPIDRFGVGTDLGTSRDSPVVNGVYKLVADAGAEGWRGVRKLSPDKQTLPGPKQVRRIYEAGQMAGDMIAPADEKGDGEPLLVPLMRGGEIVREEDLATMRERAQSQLRALPADLRAVGEDRARAPYPVDLSPAFSDGR
jgi:nicotinate phosphoribosyltransferase